MDNARIQEGKRKMNYCCDKNWKLPLKSRILKRKTSTEGNNFKRGNFLVRKKESQKLRCDQREKYGAIENKRQFIEKLKPRTLFFKGRRKKYIKRKMRNEVDEDERIENTYKIHDIGKINDEISPSPATIPGYEESRAMVSRNPSEFSLGFHKNDDSSDDCFLDLSDCSLSSISFSSSSSDYSDEIGAASYTENHKEERYKMTRKNNKTRHFNLDEYFEEFALNVDENLSRHVLSRLPKKGVFENAVESIRSLWISSKKKGFFKENLRDFDGDIDIESQISLQQNVNEKLTPNQLLISQNYIPNNYMVSPSEMDDNILMDFDNYISGEHSTDSQFFCPSFSGYNAKEPFVDEFKKSTNPKFQELNFDTPPIHLYRRNMF